MPRTLRAHLAGVDIRQAILDAADHLLARHGYSRFTMEDLADAVGVGKGTTYRYFTSKEEVALTVVDQAVEEVRRQLKAISGHGPPDAALRKMLVARVMLRHDRFADYEERFAELLDALHPALARRRDTRGSLETGIFATTIREGVKKRLFRRCDPRPTAEAMMWATEALLPSHLGVDELRDRARIAARAQRVADLLIGGILVA